MLHAETMLHICIINSIWLKEEILRCIDCLQSAAYNFRACISNNHPSNVVAYQKLLNFYWNMTWTAMMIYASASMANPFTCSMILSTSSKTSETICWTGKYWYFLHFHSSLWKTSQLRLMVVKSQKHYA